jgi:lipoate-protein ligase A
VTAASGGGWSVERRTDTARVVHGPWPAPGQRRHRTVGLCTVVGARALVLGSTQDENVVDTARVAGSGVEVVRRASGGGAVLVGPDAQVWLEVWLPRHDPLWDDDVLRSSWWLGEAWARALDGLGAPGLVVHHGRATRTPWSDLVCFAGLGPGEVTSGTAKVVGVAQRRTRAGARLHSMALLSWEPDSVLTLLALDDEQARDARRALDDVATGIRAVVGPLRDADGKVVIAAVEEAVLAALP